METKFNFNSQICTTREQSERLLALGLKKETADMYYQKLNDKWTPLVGQPFSYGGLRGSYLIPAWSLHRLIEICNHKEQDLNIVIPYGRTYDAMIARVKWLIKEGYFSKEYLE